MVIESSSEKQIEVVEHKYNIFLRLDRMPRRAALHLRRKFLDKSGIGTATWCRWQNDCVKGAKADIDGCYLKMFAELFECPIEKLFNDPKIEL